MQYTMGCNVGVLGKALVTLAMDPKIACTTNTLPNQLKHLSYGLVFFPKDTPLFQAC